MAEQPTEENQNTPAGRFGYIMMVMSNNDVKGDPADHVVLWGWNRICDVSRVAELQLDPPPRPIEKGVVVWVTESSESPDLVPVNVMEDYGDKLWVSNPAIGVLFLIPIEDVRWSPIPLSPTAVHRRELWKYIGSDSAKKWNSAK